MKRKCCRILCIGKFSRKNTDPFQDTCVLQWDSCLEAWDSHSVEWDSPLEQVGFIFSQFLRWDFSVPEVNIYYYKLTESNGSLRIPAAEQV